MYVHFKTLNLKELGHDPRMRISAAKILKGCAKLVSKPHVIDIILPQSDRFFRQERKLLIDLICGGAKTRPQPLNTRHSEAVTVSLFFSPAVTSTTPTHGHFVLSPVLLASRDVEETFCYMLRYSLSYILVVIRDDILLLIEQ